MRCSRPGAENRDFLKIDCKGLWSDSTVMSSLRVMYWLNLVQACKDNYQALLLNLSVTRLDRCKCSRRKGDWLAIL